MVLKIVVKCLGAVLFFAWLAVPANSERQAYRLGIGDKLRIKVHEWPDLSGEFSVGPNGSVFLMFIGEIVAENLSVLELAHEISEHLKVKARLNEPPSTTVEVSEFRPFFILGDVQRPGEYTYRPGLTVLQAVSLAGGLFRPADSYMLRHERDVISGRGQVALLMLQIDQLTARKARLDAELNELETIEFPDSLLSRKHEPYVQEIMTEERLLFSSYREQRAEQLEVLTMLEKFYEAEAESLAAQLKDVRAQVASAEEQLEKVRQLVSRGYAPTPRQLDMERMIVTMLGNERQLETNVLRAQQNIAQTKQRILDLHRERRNRVVLESQQSQAALEAAQQQLKTAKHLLVEATLIAPTTLRRNQQELAIEPMYEIVRRVDGAVEKIPAQDEVLVEPGDVVKVQKQFDTPLPLSAAPSTAPMIGAAERLLQDRPSQPR